MLILNLNQKLVYMYIIKLTIWLAKPLIVND